MAKATIIFEDIPGNIDARIEFDPPLVRDASYRPSPAQAMAVKALEFLRQDAEEAGTGSSVVNVG